MTATAATTAVPVSAREQVAARYRWGLNTNAKVNTEVEGQCCQESTQVHVDPPIGVRGPDELAKSLGGNDLSADADR